MRKHSTTSTGLRAWKIFVMSAGALSLFPASFVARALADGAKDSQAKFSTMEVWEDGLSEMSYYEATDHIYGVERKYTRVQLMNRQWNGGTSGVKVAADDPDAIPVFKLAMAEQIPTENYSYRFLATLFAGRPDLAPLKLTVSGQEWCGHTFKHLRWREDGLTLQSFSYYSDEGDQSWKRPKETVPYELLFLLAREAVSAGWGSTPYSVLMPLRHQHQANPDPIAARLIVRDKPKKIRCPIGAHEGRRVTIEWDGPETWFDVEAASPYRVLAFQTGHAAGQLSFVERRAYWDQDRSSGAYPTGAAP